MQPKNQEVGIILEPPDIAVINDIRRVLADRLDDDHFRKPLKPDHDGVLEADERLSSVMLNHATIAYRTVGDKWEATNQRVAFMVSAELGDTPQFEAATKEVQKLEGKLEAFGSFVTNTQANLAESRAAFSPAQTNQFA